MVFRAELSSHQTLTHDQAGTATVPHDPLNVDAAHRDPTYSPNACPQTDDTNHPSELTVTLNGGTSYGITLDDAPADHRGLLSWMNQPTYERSWFLFEAGTYGYLVNAAFGEQAAREAAEHGEFRIRLEVPEADENSGGLSVFGEKFGRYPMDVTLVIRRK